MKQKNTFSSHISSTARLLGAKQTSLEVAAPAEPISCAHFRTYLALAVAAHHNISTLHGTSSSHVGCKQLAIDTP